MSRIAKTPIEIPTGVEVSIADGRFEAKGKLGQMSMAVHNFVSIKNEDNTLTFAINKVGKNQQKDAWQQAGTTRANAANIIYGVANGWQKQLTLVGVGYRAAISGKSLNLTLGYSHPISYKLPDGISIEVPSQTEIIVKGIDKQKVGQVASEIRAYRKPEPYKGKGVRYTDEQIVRKEAKKK